MKCSIYTKSHQRDQVLLLYNQNVDVDSGKPIIDVSSGSNYMARGHLCPDAAFITQLEQDATYYFLNIAPQYQSCNNGNWKALEGAVRDYAASKGYDFDVYTGTSEGPIHHERGLPYRARGQAEALADDTRV